MSTGLRSLTTTTTEGSPEYSMFHEVYEKVDNKTQNSTTTIVKKGKKKYEYDEAHEMVGAIKVPVSREVDPNFRS